MHDRDKVITGLNDIGGFIARRLGYEQAKNYLRTIDETIVLLNQQENDIHHMGLIIEEYEKELKKQEAVKPTWQQGRAYCGSCGRRIPLKIGARYCHKCGKALKWE